MDEEQRLSKAIQNILTEAVKVKGMCDKIGLLRSNHITREEFWIAYNRYRIEEIDYE